MEITLDALRLGKPTVIKDKTYLSTKEYVDPFIEEMSKYTSKFIIQVQVPQQLTLSNTNKDITYNRVWVQAVMPDKCDVEGYHESYGLVYALDVKKPTYKIYRAYLNPFDNNLCVFNQNWIQSYELNPEETLAYSISNLMTATNDFGNKIKKMKSNYLSDDLDDVHKMLGKLINRSMLYDLNVLNGKVKISPNDVVKAFDAMYMNMASPYYIDTAGADSCSTLRYYNALNAQLNDGKDIINRFEKNILVGMLFEIIDDEQSN